jgi:hypothetical protein
MDPHQVPGAIKSSKYQCSTKSEWISETNGVIEDALAAFYSGVLAAPQPGLKTVEEYKKEFFICTLCKQKCNPKAEAKGSTKGKRICVNCAAKSY